MRIPAHVKEISLPTREGYLERVALHADQDIGQTTMAKEQCGGSGIQLLCSRVQPTGWDCLRQQPYHAQVWANQLLVKDAGSCGNSEDAVQQQDTARLENWKVEWYSLKKRQRKHVRQDRSEGVCDKHDTCSKQATEKAKAQGCERCRVRRKCCFSGDMKDSKRQCQ